MSAVAVANHINRPLTVSDEPRLAQLSCRSAERKKVTVNCLTRRTTIIFKFNKGHFHPRDWLRLKRDQTCNGNLFMHEYIEKTEPKIQFHGY